VSPQLLARARAARVGPGRAPAAPQRLLLLLAGALTANAVPRAALRQTYSESGSDDKRWAAFSFGDGYAAWASPMASKTAFPTCTGAARDKCGDSSEEGKDEGGDGDNKDEERGGTRRGSGAAIGRAYGPTRAAVLVPPLLTTQRADYTEPASPAADPEQGALPSLEGLHRRSGAPPPYSRLTLLSPPAGGYAGRSGLSLGTKM